MGSSRDSLSLFSKRIDGALFVVYFLSAVVPLAAFGFVVERYALPALERDAGAMFSMLGVMMGIGFLSLASFFALRRIVGNAVAKMDEDNLRLQHVLTASNDLALAPHVQLVSKEALKWARRISGDGTALFLLAPDGEKPLELLEASGKQAGAFFEAQQAMLEELVAAALSGKKPVSLEDPKGKGSLLVAPLLNQGERPGAMVVLRGGKGESFSLMEMDALAMLATITAISWKNADLQDVQRNFFTHVTDLVVMAVDSHVAYREGHSKKVTEFSNRIGREMKLTDDQLQTLHFSALLHDVGMLKMSRAQHASPQHYQKHPVIAHRLLSRIRLWGEVAPIVLHHHERFDGSGYPSSLAGEAIPLSSRIIALADSVDAMSRDDDRRVAIDLADIVEEVREGAGTQFDPRVVEAFLRTVARGEIFLDP